MNKKKKYVSVVKMGEKYRLIWDNRLARLMGQWGIRPLTDKEKDYMINAYYQECIKKENAMDLMREEIKRITMYKAIGLVVNKVMEEFEYKIIDKFGNDIKEN